MTVLSDLERLWADTILKDLFEDMSSIELGLDSLHVYGAVPTRNIGFARKGERVRVAIVDFKSLLMKLYNNSPVPIGSIRLVLKYKN